VKETAMVEYRTQGEQDDVIQISHQEAMSPHVDDLLKRQLSLRGESGMLDTGPRAWYYQNWFVFMVAGAIAALLAWAVLEPVFDDFLYVQGPIQDMDLDEPMPSRFTSGDLYLEPLSGGKGWVKVQGERIWLAVGTREIPPDSRQRDLRTDELEIGQRIAVFVCGHR